MDPSPTVPSNAPLLDVLLPLLPLFSQYLALLSGAITTSIRAVQWALSKASYPVILLSPFPVFIYVFAPLIVFTQVALDIVVFTPARTILSLLELVYPLYVLMGIACITGLLVGGIGRLLTLRILVWGIALPVERSKAG
ncbi:uncharacterized protein BT62DRAFT_1008956 [Guyanagaster necrorhizus]|uniref:Uncharacterized protein n=1 Tax=Guyanagaster necrorhizus TaxID=856835 RepID=A0A9P8APQ7_9AGAR|nr:uncharacterized protein BT62DRAFT_1008956 [Guyanagaster necrorhizus MCA 3950]KAG7443598.1 hypothetical protein BT62DRAFT_1008956 [Guyanagaster necrorhizus MCA 3950]